MRRAKHWGELAARGWRGEEGSAALEFVTVGVLLLVPLVYLVVALGTVQAHAFGVESGARQVARVLASGATDAPRRAEAAMAWIADEYGLDAESLAVSFDCEPAGTECPAPGAVVRVRVSGRAPLPLLPTPPGWEHATSVPVEGSAVQRISRTWGAQ